MKRAILLVIFIAAVTGGGVYWLKKHGDEAKPAGEKVAAEKPDADDSRGGGSRTSLDTNGNVVISMDNKTQEKVGIKVARPESLQISPELKSYGRVLDPAPLAALMTELAAAQAAYAASSNELMRLKTLAGQGNTSTRALQTGEAAALRDQLAVQSAKDRLNLAWGRAVANQTDLPGFLQSLASQETVLIRVDLPGGEVLAAPPSGARIVNLAGSSVEAQFLSQASNIDPQTQGQGFIFLLKPNTLRFLPGEAVTGYLRISGEPLAGVIIPREAIVRTEGSGWVYLRTGGGKAFTRVQVVLDHPVEAGWFVTKSVTDTDNVVVTGAQTLLSEELKASIKAD